MVVSIDVVSVSSIEMTPSLFVTTETQRLLINVGDGTQRMCMEHRLRLAKLQHVLLTQVCASTVGGLPGMILTVSDAVQSSHNGFQFIGPKGLQAYVHALRHVMYRPAFSMTVTEVQSASQVNLCFQDEELEVFAVPVAKCSSRVGMKRKLVERDEDAEAEAATASCSSVSYILQTRPQRGKFLVDKARAFGVPKGPLYGQLHRGLDVTLDDGTIVHAADCVAPSLPATACAVLACPSVEYVDALVASELFQRFQIPTTTSPSNAKDNGSPEMALQVLYHLGDVSVLEHPTYVAWIQRFGPNVEHVVLNAPGVAAKSVFRASVKLQVDLHAAFPASFPSWAALEHQDVDAQALPGTKNCSMALASKPVRLGESRLCFTLSPSNRCGFDTSKCFAPIVVDGIETTSDTTSSGKASDFIVSSDTTEVESKRGLPSHLNARLSFLGTGSAIPSKYRNVTGNLLQVPSPEVIKDDKNKQVDHDISEKGFMIDCGEGTLGQLYRMVNGDHAKLSALLHNLQCVWISHNHADHHLGLLRLLSFRAHDTNFETKDVQPLLIIGPKPLFYWLQEYAAIDPTVAGTYLFVDNAAFDEHDDRFFELTATTAKTRQFLNDALQITEFACIPVQHTYLSYALVLIWQNTLKLAFSGDCRPNEEFATKAQNAFLMVHEATLEDAMEAEAKAKKHSTTSEAVAIGKLANVQHLVLTHFSQRYPKLPVDEASQHYLCAMDLLTVAFAELGEHQQQQQNWSETCAAIVAKHEAQQENENE